MAELMVCTYFNNQCISIFKFVILCAEIFMLHTAHRAPIQWIEIQQNLLSPKERTKPYFFSCLISRYEIRRFFVYVCHLNHLTIINNIKVDKKYIMFSLKIRKRYIKRLNLLFHIRGCC